MKSTLFYAREVHYVNGERVETVNVRFAQKSNRDYWLSQGTVPDNALALKQWLSTKPTGTIREPLHSNSTEVQMILSMSTWEYIDGVSYAHKRTG